jgi:hypothetical protein
MMLTMMFCSHLERAESATRTNCSGRCFHTSCCTPPDCAGQPRHVQAIGAHYESGTTRSKAVETVDCDALVLTSAMNLCPCTDYGDHRRAFTRAPHVLNIQAVVPNVLLKDGSFLLESVAPARVVGDDLYGTLLGADHASTVSLDRGYC